MKCSRTTLALSLLLAGATVARAEPKAGDHSPPVFHHTPVLTAVQDEQVSITTQIVDESDIFAPLLWWRYVGQDAFQSVDLTKKDDLWGASIPANQPIEYWLEAYDELGNGPAREGSPEKPFKIQLTPKPPVMKPVAAAPAEVPPPTADGTAIPPSSLVAAPPSTADAPPGSALVAPPPTDAAVGTVTTPADSTVISLSDPPKPPDIVTPPANPPQIVTPPANPPDIVPPPAAGATVPDFEKPKPEPGQIDLNAPPHDASQPTAADLAAETPQGPQETPVYKRWWFWTGAGVIVAGAVTGALLYVLAPQPVYQNVFQASVKH